ncbi:pyridoxal-dependent decarboxylase [Streptomyces sp. RFCAC02]|uniref:pyridoxal phosphate-dependent decarboxylase family protein n=1 Tax=Streptomyces sp. RFCAC02 TaxID=2499143 RepID=UPI00143CF786|nr:pyridoxal-dependent decarboxylase [Streptomyces sp. RFCAC02]
MTSSYRGLGDLFAHWYGEFFATTRTHAHLEATSRDGILVTAAEELAAALREGSVDPAAPDNFAHQLPVPSKAALLGLLMGAMYQQNQASRESSPVTSRLEDEVIRSYAAMLGLGDDAWGYFCSGGTSASLHALWTLTGRAAEPAVDLICSHTTHISFDRIGEVLKAVRLHRVECDAHDRADTDAVARAVARSREHGRLPIVVATCGTTGAGQIDPVADLVELRRTEPFLLHADAAWGGFLSALTPTPLLGRHRRDVAALAHVDSIAVDPHKMASMPVGCGVVLFRDPALKALVRRGSPYVFAEEAGPHHGQFSLTMSRNGMFAAAHWLQNQVSPLTADGVGADVARILAATRVLADEMERAGFRVLFEPAVGIVVCVAPRGTFRATSEVTRRVGADCLRHDRRPAGDLPVLSTYRVTTEAVLDRVERQTGLLRDGAELLAFRLVIASPPLPGFRTHATSAARALARHCAATS